MVLYYRHMSEMEVGVWQGQSGAGGFVWNQNPSVDFKIGNGCSSAKSGKTLTINPKLLEKCRMIQILKEM